jgi:hypothetical protein
MIFKPELVELIIGGKKTMARRKVKPGEPCKYHEGRDYALQPGRGKKAVDRIYITGIRQEKVGDIGHQDALREGFENVGHFIDYWQALYKRAIDFDQLVWCLSFELYRGQDVTHDPARDTVRLLRVAWDPGVAAGGVVPARRRAPEPEPVDVAELKYRWTEESAARWRAAMDSRERADRLAKETRAA